MYNVYGCVFLCVVCCLYGYVFKMLRQNHYRVHFLYMLLSHPCMYMYNYVYMYAYVLVLWCYIAVYLTTCIYTKV